jgi:translation initiation factor eIF-2B subunit epsilon
MELLLNMIMRTLISLPLVTPHLPIQILTEDTLNLTDSSISDIGGDTDSEEENPHRRRHSSASSAQIDNLNKEEFHTEAEDSLNRAFSENHSVENAAIELKTLRMATNVTFHEVREAIVAALMCVLVSSPPATVTKEFEKWGQLLEEFTEDDEASLDTVFLVQRYFARGGAAGKENSFVKGLQQLYQADVLDEDVIFKWFGDDRSNGVGERWGEDMAALRKKGEQLVNWLREAEEESD